MAKSEKKNKNVHEIEIKVEGEVWKNALDSSFKKNVKNAKVDGFRKGKVPKNIYLKHYGAESLYTDACEEVVDSAYHDAMDSSKLIPVVQPAVSIKDINDDGVTFIFTIITKPEVKIKSYKGLGVKEEKVKVTKEEIDHEIGHLLEQYTEAVSKDGKVENGDIAVIDFEGFKDGVAFDGGKGENYSLEIGSNTFIPGFEEKVIGMKPGEEKDIDLTFPKDYQATDLAGKDVVFHVKVNEVKEKVERKLDEDFFLDLDIEGVKDEKSLRDKISHDIEHEKKHQVEDEHINKLLEAVSKNVEVDIPQEMVDEEVSHLMERFERQLAMQGIGLDMYYAFTKSSEEDLRKRMDHEAYQNVLYRLMLEEIMNLEKIEVKDKDIDEEVKKLSKDYGMKEEDLLKQIGGKDMIKYDLEMRKTVDLLKDLNK